MTHRRIWRGGGGGESIVAIPPPPRSYAGAPKWQNNGVLFRYLYILNILNLKRVIGLATLEFVGWERCVIAVSLPTDIPYGFGGKRSYAYGSLNSIIYASWLRYFGRYLYNLDFEYATRGYCKLVYSYIRVWGNTCQNHRPRRKLRSKQSSLG